MEGSDARMARCDSPTQLLALRVPMWSGDGKFLVCGPTAARVRIASEERATILGREFVERRQDLDAEWRIDLPRLVEMTVREVDVPTESGASAFWKHGVA